MNNSVNPSDNTVSNILEMSNIEDKKFMQPADSSSNKRIRVALVSISASGHFEPIKQIGEVLVEAGHEVHIVVNGGEEKFVKSSKEKCEQMGFNMHYTECGLSGEKDIWRTPTSSTELTYDTFQI